MKKVAEIIQLIANIIFIASTAWAIIFSFKEKVKIINNLEFHRPVFIFIFLLGLIALIYLNFKWINRIWNVYRDKTSPERRLKKLGQDVKRLQGMTFKLSKNIDHEPVPTGDPALLNLTDYVIRQLNDICGLKLPKLFNYPKYFRAIHIFVERGNVNEVKRISHDFDDFDVEYLY